MFFTSTPSKKAKKCQPGNTAAQIGQASVLAGQRKVTEVV